MIQKGGIVGCVGVDETNSKINSTVTETTPVPPRPVVLPLR